MKIEKTENKRPLATSQVKLKIMGKSLREIKFIVRSVTPATRKLSKDQYMILETGEILPYSHTESRIESLSTIRQSLAKLRDLINTNVTDSSRVHWITLTYALNMKDEKKLYEDYRRFWLRYKYHIKQHYNTSCEYICAVEPQGRGAWHVHALFIYSDKAPFIENSTFTRLWRHGYTSIKAVKGNNFGNYLSLYLSDMDIADALKNGMGKASGIKEVTTEDEAGNKIKKAIVKGARLRLYPRGMRLFRKSRGIKPPIVISCTEAEAMQEINDAELIFEKTIKIINDFQEIVNVVNYRTYKKKTPTDSPDGST